MKTSHRNRAEQAETSDDATAGRVNWIALALASAPLLLFTVVVSLALASLWWERVLLGGVLGLIWLWPLWPVLFGKTQPRTPGSGKQKP